MKSPQGIISKHLRREALVANGLSIIEELLWAGGISSVLSRSVVRRGDFLETKRKIVIDDEEFEVTLSNNKGVWKVLVDGHEFSVKTDGGAGRKVVRKRKESRKSVKSGVVSSPIPGKIVSLSVGNGDSVLEGDVVMILEAMKMQNEIQAPISGKITQMSCEPGDSIEANSPLLIIEPESTE